MTDTLTIALAQLNPTVGDVVGNARMLSEARAAAAAMAADLVVSSELVISGYPPESGGNRRSATACRPPGPGPGTAVRRGSAAPCAMTRPVALTSSPAANGS